MISAKVLADSVSPYRIRLLTLQLQYPRFIHSEFMTHRVFSRNAASSRAIPVSKMIEQIQTNPAMPVYWGKNQKGMQAREELEYFPPRQRTFFDGHRNEYYTEYSPREAAQQIWLSARDEAIEKAKQLISLDAHKQIVNRLLEPWQEMQTIVTATEWENFFELRLHPDAQPEIKALAEAMHAAISGSTSKSLKFDEWHLPYVDDASMIFGGGLVSTMEELKKWSVARCARVSYLNHDQSDPSPTKDVVLHDQLLSSGHFSPFEHQAKWTTSSGFSANFRGWQSYRSELGF